nr:integrase, catalytic region, zinc finger, CCHC-type, peptidase aspartic, catalytic [Tanacetum cinerariifolium]
MGYDDYQIGNVTISRVYYVEGLGHNLFSMGQFCDSDFEVAFRQHTCFIRNLDGVDLLTGSRGNNLYTLSLQDMLASSPIYLLSMATKTKSWLWHCRKSLNETCDIVDTPMVEKSKLDEDREGKAVDPSHYREYQQADLFTKALGGDRIEFLINKLGMRSFTPETLKQLMDEVDKSMDTMIEPQVAMDEALVPRAQ